MRIRSFTAPTAAAAMALVRAEMGDDAVIIAVDQASNGHGVIVRAAVDEAKETPAPTAPLPIEDRLEALLKTRLAPLGRLGHAA